MGQGKSPGEIHHACGAKVRRPSSLTKRASVWQPAARSNKRLQSQHHHDGHGALRLERYSESRLARVAIGRFLEADEIAETIAFLLSDRASALTGLNLRADGGFSVM
jgi:NAD(P)-dependent dehydrogenase (short-subunit alcohol dehydrogenase family)